MISQDAKTAGKPKPNIGARLPHDVYAKLIELKDSSGKTESELINEAIAAYLGIGNKATVPDQQFQIRHYMGVSAFLIEIGFNKLGLFYRLDKSEEVCILEKRLGDVD